MQSSVEDLTRLCNQRLEADGPSLVEVCSSSSHTTDLELSQSLSGDLLKDLHVGLKR